MNDIQPTSTLPKILAVLDREDHGSCEDGASAICPHCGAEGRYIFRFVCADGKIHGAMSGCIQLFPKHRLTDKVMAVFEKRDRYEKAKWVLPSWDQAVVGACYDLGAGKIDLPAWESIVRNAFAKRDAYHLNKHGASGFRTSGRRYGVRR